MLGSRSPQATCPKDIYEKAERYRDEHTIRDLRKKKSNQEWCQCIREWEKRLEAAKFDLSHSERNLDVDYEEVDKYSQFIAVHLFAMNNLIKGIEKSGNEPPKNSKARQDLLARLWTSVYAVDESYVPLGKCSLTAVIDLEHAMQSPSFQKKEWLQGPGAPGKAQQDVMHGWHGVLNALLAGSS